MTVDQNQDSRSQPDSAQDRSPDPRHDGFRSDGHKSNFLAEKLKRAFTAGLVFSLTFSFCRVGAGSGIFTYEKIHFTQDGSPTGTPLVPNFVWSSCWFALGNDDSGNIYVAISNEIEPDGDVAIFKYDPVLNQMTFINDLKTCVSLRVKFRKS